MELVKNALIRGIIPLFIMTGIAVIMNVQNLDKFQVKSTFITGLIITAVAAASVCYDIEEWTLIKQSVVHFIIMLFTVFPCLLLSGWFAINGVEDVLKVFGIFLVVGLILWSVIYFVLLKLL
ncbi:DUF3021 family protein [Marinilactibacillus psychrotolerans]|uniref:DUF3021 domain-containing protein n=1 Tax=Marinilactibacillus psychrotolerans TaxID=191770 RepID=A0A5R9C8I1_9LACT|nr:DUF3021 family protein [Marinilactibacillus psychrotolerans]TLQ09584.1 DUF3021 domain-containing protein [Marinilactibacillus psychrotolerans]